MKVLITGGTGLIGSLLCEKLGNRGYDVAVLSRNKNKRSDFKIFEWNVDKGEVDREAIETADCIIHLAGENISDKRWTERRKKEIIDSRVKSAELLFENVRLYNKNLKAFISASAIGYYGLVTSEKIFTEDDPPASDFLGNTCVLWEEAANNFMKLGARVVKIRTSPVLSANEGILKKMLLPAKLGISSPIGSGRQYFPWIHINDLRDIYVKALEDEKMDGVYNAAAPDHKTNEAFTRTLTRVLNKPFIFPNVPAFLIKLIFGEMGEAALKGSRISSEKIQTAGYKFSFPDLEKALKHLLL